MEDVVVSSAQEGRIPCGVTFGSDTLAPAADVETVDDFVAVGEHTQERFGPRLFALEAPRGLIRTWACLYIFSLRTTVTQEEIQIQLASWYSMLTHFFSQSVILNVAQHCLLKGLH